MLGDAVVLALITLAGLGTHDSLSEVGARFLPNFVPALLAWLFIAWPLGVFHENNLKDWQHLWRPFWAMLLSAPISAFLRSLWLGNPAIIIVFVMVLGGLGAVVITLWRAIVWFFIRRREAAHG